MNLQDMVTDHTPTPRDPDSREILHNHMHCRAEEIIRLTEEAKESLLRGEDVWDQVLRLAAYRAVNKPSASKEIVALLGSAHEGSQEELLDIFHSWQEEAKRSLANEKRHSMIGSFSLSVGFLESIFEEKTPAILSEVTGVRSSTVRNWIKGRGTTWRSTFRVGDLALCCYSLYEELSWPEEKIACWYETPLPSGRTPREIWGARGSSQEVREGLAHLGVSISW